MTNDPARKPRNGTPIQWDDGPVKCPRCGEASDLVERQGSTGFCSVCAQSWVIPRIRIDTDTKVAL